MDALAKTHGPGILAAADLADYRSVQTFVSKISDMLRLVQHTLRPRSFDDYVNHVFD
jgi:hypothetical protein